MHDAQVEARIRQKFHSVAIELDERRRRQWAAAEAQDLGWGGVSLVSRATGMSRPTIVTGLKELQQSLTSRAAAARSVRRPGGGRRKVTEVDSELLAALERLIDPATRGDPMSPLRWTCKSTAKLADELTRQNHPVSDRTVAVLLKQCGYSLQANRKTREGLSHPDRNAQFEYTSTGESSTFIEKGSRRFLSTRKRRNWSGNSRILERNGARTANRKKSKCTTFPTRDSARRFLTAYTASS